MDLVFSLVKRWVIGTRQGAISVTHLLAYFDEWVFRFNRRTSRSRGLSVFCQGVFCRSSA